MSTTPSNVTSADNLAKSFFTAYNAHDLSMMLSLCSGDAQLCYVPMGEQGRGRAQEVGKKIWEGLIDAFPDLYVRVQSMFADERNAAAEVMIGGTQRKEFLNVPSQGRHYDLPHAFLLKACDRGVLVQITAYWDNVSFYSQLGKTTLDCAQPGRAAGGNDQPFTEPVLEAHERPDRLGA